MQKTVQDLLAEAAINDVNMRYCRAADRTDFDLLRTCFHSDAVLVFSFFTGGVDEFVNMARRGLSGYAVTTHFVGNRLISVAGDTARAEFYTLATHRIAKDEKGPERDYIASVRYVDRLESRQGDWRIVRRQCVLDWARTDPVPEYCDGSKTGEARRDQTDPSYL